MAILRCILRNGVGAAALALVSCALPQPTHIERQDFVPQREVQVASIVREAQENFARGRLFDAELGLRKALVIAPETTQLSLNLARTLAKNGQTEEAIPIFEKQLARKPNDLLLLNYVGESLFDAGHFEKGEEYFSRAARIIDEKWDLKEIVPGDLVVMTRLNQSTAAFRRGDVTAALCWAHMAYEISPTPDNLLRVVRLETARGAYAVAEGLITNFLAFTPGANDGRVYLLRAIARLALNQKDPAIDDLNAALKREETIQQFALELRIISQAVIPPTVDEEGIEHSLGESEDGEEVVPESLKDNQRLYIPTSVLAIIDEYRLRKEAELGA